MQTLKFDGSIPDGSHIDDEKSCIGDSQSEKFSRESLKKTFTLCKNSKKVQGLRRGKWTVEEEEYSSRLIQDFKNGLLPLQGGTTLRSFLSEMLNCDPMRISKKYTGGNSIGKQAFKRCQEAIDALKPEDKEKNRSELAYLKKRFIDRITCNTEADKELRNSVNSSDTMPLLLNKIKLAQPSVEIKAESNFEIDTAKYSQRIFVSEEHKDISNNNIALCYNNTNQLPTVSHVGFNSPEHNSVQSERCNESNNVGIYCSAASESGNYPFFPKLMMTSDGINYVDPTLSTNKSNLNYQNFAGDHCYENTQFIPRNSSANNTGPHHFVPSNCQTSRKSSEVHSNYNEKEDMPHLQSMTELPAAVGGICCRVSIQDLAMLLDPNLEKNTFYAQAAENKDVITTMLDKQNSSNSSNLDHEFSAPKYRDPYKPTESNRRLPQSTSAQDFLSLLGDSEAKKVLQQSFSVAGLALANGTNEFFQCSAPRQRSQPQYQNIQVIEERLRPNNTGLGYSILQSLHSYPPHYFENFVTYNQLLRPKQSANSESSFLEHTESKRSYEGGDSDDFCFHESHKRSKSDACEQLKEDESL